MTIVTAIGRAKVLVLASALIAVAACDEAPKAQRPQGPPPVTVAQPLQKTLTEWDEYTGRFDAIDTVEVRARVSGYLTEVRFRDGDTVKKGDLLFVIDPRPFRRALDQALAELNQAKIRANFTLRDLERARPLVRRGNLSEQVFDERQRAAREAAAAVQAAEARVKTAQLNVDFTQIRAPITGRASRRLVSVGNAINGGASNATLLTTIVSLDPIHFYFDVNEAAFLKYVRLSHNGSRPSSRDRPNAVRLALKDEKGFPHKGFVDFIDNRIDRGTGTMRGRAVFRNPDQLFTPGLFGRIRLVGSAEYKALLLPDAAINTDQANRFVYVVGDDGTVLYRQVTLGPLVDGLRVVRTGLKPTDRVIISGIQRARTGAKVTPKRGKVEPPKAGTPAQ